MYKEFKIGEYAIGGIITIERQDELLKIQALDWDTKEAVETKYYALPEDCSHVRNEIWTDLLDWTSDYYLDQIMEYLDSIIDFRTYYEKLLAKQEEAMQL